MKEKKITNVNTVVEREEQNISDSSEKTFDVSKLTRRLDHMVPDGDEINPRY